jgi:uncharacterized lipoprotein YajG
MTQYSKILFYALFLLPLLFFSGCAYVDQTISLKYQNSKPFVKNKSETVSIMINSKTELEKNSQDLWIIGSLNNQDGMQQAEILTSDNPHGWIEQALTHDLSASGYQVSNNPVNNALSDLSIIVSDINMSLNLNRHKEYTDVNCIFKFDAELSKTAQSKRNLALVVQENKRYQGRLSREAKEEIMNNALRDAVRRVLLESGRTGLAGE